jgi:hypothetical protein
LALCTTFSLEHWIPITIKIVSFLYYPGTILLLSQFGVPNRIITNLSKSDPYTNFNQKQWHNIIFMIKFLLFLVYLISKGSPVFKKKNKNSLSTPYPLSMLKKTYAKLFLPLQIECGLLEAFIFFSSFIVSSYQP